MLVAATDGACPGNPGPGGWAWVTEDGRFDSGGEAPPSTNNRMELVAVKCVLESHTGIDLRIITDSELIVKTFTEWLPGWRSRGMRTSTGEPVSNAELVLNVDRLTWGRQVRWEHVRGHSGHALNERADALAVAAARRYAWSDPPSPTLGLPLVEIVDDFVCNACYLRKPFSQRAASSPDLCVDCT